MGNTTVEQDRAALKEIVRGYIDGIKNDLDKLKDIESYLEQNKELDPTQQSFLRNFIGAQ